MNFQTDTVSSTFDERNRYTSMQNDRAGQRSDSSATNLTTTKTGWGGKSYTIRLDTSTSVVGMNVQGVSQVIEAIENYCTNIENYLKNLTPEADSTLAYQSKDGEIKDALEKYMTQVRSYCLNLVSQLRAFADKIQDVQNQWIAATGNMAQNIGSATGSYSAGSSYTRQVQ